jgi:phosphoserine phosphatase RsbU/P
MPIRNAFAEFGRGAGVTSGTGAHRPKRGCLSLNLLAMLPKGYHGHACQCSGAPTLSIKRLMTDNAIGIEPSKARLLVVDDNEDNRYTLIMRLQIEGYEDITAAEDGENALELIRQQAFDLMLLDVMMPKVDGYQVLSQLKADRTLRDLPVIMISALNEMNSVVRCIELGADDYLPKPFDPTLLKARVGATLEKKRLRDEVRSHLARIEEELAAARQLQLAMVPSRFPEPSTQWPVEIFATMEPAREVGGDLYDFFEIGEGLLCFLVGDVSGKGVSSALFMARAKNVIRLLARLLRSPDGSTASPADIVAAVNRELAQDNLGMMFVTLFFGLMNVKSGEVRFTNAGHNPPYFLSNGSVTPVTACKGRPLGVRDNSTYQSGTLRLSPGDALYLYTDGVTEAANRNDELFAEARLEEVLRTAASRRPIDLIKAVVDAVQSFADGAPRSDDITTLAIRRTEPGD